uniref:LITAF domain-containing protein n=1 Tax=Hucho hucho TaxID=62062 RepID=A0A4W5PX40_9TELE
MSDVTHHAGTFSWTMCLVFILSGLFLGCCLIPFFLRSFKDAYHTCPRCRMVLHIHRKSCCPMTSDPPPRVRAPRSRLIWGGGYIMGASQKESYSLYSALDPIGVGPGSGQK